jgi:hypothetical protein
MRRLVILLIVAGAAPAAAQPSLAPYVPMMQAREGQAAADALAARIRDVAAANAQAMQQARSQTDQALGNLAPPPPPLLPPPQPPTVPLRPGAPPQAVPPLGFASISDAALAQSNARIRAAAANRK